MFEKNEYVFYGSGGICSILDICVAPLEHMPKDRTYYVMKPLHDPNSTVYVPTDNEGIFLRRLMTREEAEELLDRIPFVTTVGERNPKLLRAKYQELMRMNDPLEWVRVIKTVYARSHDEACKRPLSDTERGYSESAKRHLYAELALALGRTEGEMESYITEYVQGTV